MRLDPTNERERLLIDLDGARRRVVEAIPVIEDYAEDEDVQAALHELDRMVERLRSYWMRGRFPDDEAPFSEPPPYRGLSLVPEEWPGHPTDPDGPFT